MKIFAYYLPQFHKTQENDKWWGEDFTEWTNIKRAKPLFTGHNQPKIPLGDNYYDLLDINVMKWQGDLARRYGISGFCVYHYWFEGKKLLHKPMEQLLEHKEIDFPFFCCWANESWTNAWATSDGKPKMLMKQTYGNREDWDSHFNYLIQFFNDERYIKINNKPILVIYRPEQIHNLNDMLDYLNELSKKFGFDGICYMSQQVDFLLHGKDNSRFDYRIEYQPGYSEYNVASSYDRKINSIEDRLLRLLNDKLHIPTPKIKKLIIKDYDKIWKDILSHVPIDDKVVPGAFVGWDNTPRYKKNGKVIVGGNPTKFYQYFRHLIKKTKEQYNKDMIFVFAWNEWTEGGYLEPDKEFKYGFLEAIKKALGNE